jgi:hypothetical protein
MERGALSGAINITAKRVPGQQYKAAKAVFFSPLFFSFHLDRLPFHCVLMFESHLSLHAKKIL